MFSLSVTLAAVSYVFLALGLQTIARQRGINNPWLAWVPVARNWLLGCISDQYQYVKQGRSTRRRTLLVVLPVVEAALMAVSFVSGLFAMILNAEAGATLDTTSALLAASLLLVRLVSFVFQTLAVYDLHRSCRPDYAKLLLVLGILIPCVRAVAVFLFRDQEQGMPPRRSSMT